jgi:hypothetical protein
MAAALRSDRSERKLVEVRVLSWPPVSGETGKRTALRWLRVKALEGSSPSLRTAGW